MGEQAHHFLFALPTDDFDPNLPVDFIVMGVNPGESPECWNLVQGTGHEESFQKDFHVDCGSATKSRQNWRKKVREFTPQGNNLLTEFFFWSSIDQNQFKSRFGTLQKSLHVPFCHEINSQLIECASPKAVVFSGVGHCEFVARTFDLSVVEKHKTNSSNRKLLLVYRDGARWWFFIPHLSAARGITNDERRHALAIMNRYLSQK